MASGLDHPSVMLRRALVLTSRFLDFALMDRAGKIRLAQQLAGPWRLGSVFPRQTQPPVYEYTRESYGFMQGLRFGAPTPSNDSCLHLQLEFLQQRLELLLNPRTLIFGTPVLFRSLFDLHHLPGQEHQHQAGNQNRNQEEEGLTARNA